MSDAFTILVGDCRAMLATLPAECVQTVVTSPPFWALRAYVGLEPQVWGGSEGCGHEWGDAMPRPGNEWRQGKGSDVVEHTRRMADCYAQQHAGSEAEAAIRLQISAGASLKSTLATNPATAPKTIALREGSGTVSGGQYCQRCGAWRGHWGLEPSVGQYVANTVEVLRAVRRVLRPDGTVWWNLADSYAGTGYGTGTGHFAQRDNPSANTPGPKNGAGLKPKDMCLIPERVWIALQEDGWWVRNDIIWWKASCMPESCTDRCTRDFEHIRLLAKSQSYFFDIEAGKESGQATAASQLRATYGRYDAGGAGRRMARKTGGDGKPDFLQQEGNDYGGNSRSPRTVWRLKPEPSNYEFCLACETMYVGGDRKGIKELCGACGERWPRKKRSAKACPSCGDDEATRERECPTCKSRTDWVAHYAAFPSGLPRKCIAMGTSEKGECPKCGMPWARVVERTAGAPESYNGSSFTRGKTAAPRADVGQGERTAAVRTVDWQPQCECTAGDPVPQQVLDICLGTGTTAIVAVQMGRRAVGIELSPSYAKLAAERIRVLGTHKAKAAPRAAMPLFQEVSDE